MEKRKPYLEPRPEKFLDSQVAIITGAAHGIGRGIALEFAKEGAKIVAADINDQNAQVTADQLDALGALYLICHTDIGREEDHQKLIEEALKKFGKIDVLVNNAAAWSGKALFGCSPQEFRRTIDTTLTGTILLTQAVAQKMVEAKTPGKILFITSIHDSVIRRHPDYSAAKAGLAMFIRETAQELAPYSIRVNGIAPGAIDTNDQHVESNSSAQASVVPLTQKAGLPRDIARMAVVLASDYWSGYVTGEIYKVDGGLSDVNWLTFEVPLVNPLTPPESKKA